MNIIIETIIEALAFIITIALPFILLSIPFLFAYFTYRLIKGLMKYHHDLKNGDREKGTWK